MPTADQASMDVNATPIRVPKLAVRNRVSDVPPAKDVKNWIEEHDDHARRPPLSAHSSEQTVSPAFVRRQSDQSQQSQDSLDRLRHRSSNYGMPKSQANEPAGKKKKSSGVLGFLTLKEPSTSAWEEFAEAQKKAAAQKTGRASITALPGVSSQKLPDYVPPTNSKWDGLPESANAKSKRMSTQSKISSKRMSAFSTTTKHTSVSAYSSHSNNSGEQSPAKRYGSLSSKPSRPTSVQQSKRGSVQSTATSAEPQVVPNVAKASATATVAQAVPRSDAVTPWDEPQEETQTNVQDGGVEKSPETFLHPPSPPPILPEPSSLLSTPELELPEIPGLSEYEPSPQHSPRTPPPDVSIGIFPSIAEQYQCVQLGDQKAPSDENGTFWHSDTDYETDPSNSSRTIMRPSPLNFSRPRERRSAVATTEPDMPVEPTIEEGDEESDAFVPTLRDENGRTSPFFFEPLSGTHLGQATNIPRSTPSQLPGRKCSTSSRMTSNTATTATTMTAPLHSPTFSTQLSESTRPSTAASTVSTATACQDRPLSPVRSNSDTSIAPSEMSAQWRMTPKERLGLGGRVTKRERSEVLPWETVDVTMPISEVTAKRQSATSQAGLDSGKLKRLSMRLGRK